MKSEWRVTRNPMWGEECYEVYRLLDKQKIKHSGNMEYDFMRFADKKSAQKRADELNKMETGK